MAVATKESGLFFTSLDTQQTNVDQHQEQRTPRRRLSPGDKDFERRAAREAYRRPEAAAVEINFRHSGWILERLRVQHAMLAANLTGDRRERFDQCGGDCVVEYSPSTRRHRLRANYCGDRFCVPCARARSKRLERAIRQRLGGTEPLFITLTLRADDSTLAGMLNHLLASFRRLRQQKLWKKHVTGGVAVTEVKKGTGSHRWHVHLHVLAVGGFIRQAELSDAWRVASGGSFIVDVSRVKRDGKGIGYVAKYAGKGWTAEVVRDHDALVECICSLRGRRLLIGFGTWRKLESDADQVDPGDWRRVDRLTTVIGAYDRGEHWARAVMRSIGFEPQEAANPPPTADEAPGEN